MKKETYAKAWDWSAAKDSYWLEPAPEAYYFAERWSRLGFHVFLDYGCGLGRHSLFFAERGFEVKAFDLSEEAVTRLQERAKELQLPIEVLQSDMHHVSYPDESIDCLIAYHVISHTNEKGIRLIAKEFERLLKPGGEAFFDLCSQETDMFVSGRYPKIDPHTILRTDEGPEYNVPHYCATLDDVLDVFGAFEILKIEHKDECYLEGARKNQKHYWVHLRKR